MILVSQIGARRHYAVPAALERANLLHGLYTDFCMAAPWLRLLGKVLPKSFPVPGWKSMSGREAFGVPDGKITCLWSSPSQIIQARRRDKVESQYSRWVSQNEAFGRAVVAKGFGSAQAVYAFNAAAMEIFEAAKLKGLQCILDMTIAPLEIIEQLLSEERSRFGTLEVQTESTESVEVLVERERREWALADLILCGSEYVSDALVHLGVPRTKCRVARWGYSGPSVMIDRSPRTGSLRVLVAGSVELRKGFQYVLQAAKLLPPGQFQFRFVGPRVSTNGRAIEDLYADEANSRGTPIEFAGAIPRTDMTLEYQRADVLLHPSLAEGSANVCYEAMAHGLPVIATPNAGAAITDGVEGLIIPIRDPEAIATSLQRLANDSSLRLSMGQAGRKRAASLTIHEYQQQLAQAVQELF